MTIEQLEELIKQKATIYIVYFNLNKVFEEELNECSWSVDKQGNLVEHCLDSSYNYESYRLFETKEQAEWALKTVAERTERFEPPMWEEIEKRKDDYLFRFAVNNEIISFVVMIDEDIDLTDIMIYNASIGKNIFWKALTKENYEKACEIVRDLFKEDR